MPTIFGRSWRPCAREIRVCFYGRGATVDRYVSLLIVQKFTDFQVAVSSLRLKILRHEGVFSLEKLPPELNEEERNLVLVLAHGRSLTTLCQMVGIGNFHQKIQRWFLEVMS